MKTWFHVWSSPSAIGEQWCSSPVMLLSLVALKDNTVWPYSCLFIQSLVKSTFSNGPFKLVPRLWIVVKAPGWAGHHSHCWSCSTRLEMGKWMEDLNMAIEMAKKSTEKSDMLLDNSVCNRSNSKWCFPHLKMVRCWVLFMFPHVNLVMQMEYFIIHTVMESSCALVVF